MTAVEKPAGVIAESPSVWLTCTGTDHRGVDKRTGASYRVCACDCAKDAEMRPLQEEAWDAGGDGAPATGHREVLADLQARGLITARESAEIAESIEGRPVRFVPVNPLATEWALLKTAAAWSWSNTAIIGAAAVTAAAVGGFFHLSDWTMRHWEVLGR